MPAARSGVPVAGDGVGVSGVRVRHRPQARLKYNAGIHPKFRGLIVGLAQVIDAPSPSGIFFVLQSVRRCLFSFRFAMEKFLLAVRFSLSCKLRLLERLIVFSQYGFDDATGVPRFLMFLACHNVRGMIWLIAFDLMRNACGTEWISTMCNAVWDSEFCPHIGRYTALIQIVSDVVNLL
jgi:hypothetical protein